jgi:ferritin-like metal-binding protein YciE
VGRLARRERSAESSSATLNEEKETDEKLTELSEQINIEAMGKSRSARA